MNIEYPGTNSVPNLPRLFILLSDWWRYAITRHQSVLTRVICVHIINLVYD